MRSLPMAIVKKKMPRDMNKLARFITDQITAPTDPNEGKNAAAVTLGRLGGLKGGKARADALSPKKRSAIAKKAARARWDKQ